MQLTDKIAVVTGASSGIGAQFSKDLVEKGAQVFGLARRTDRLDALTAELGSRFKGIECDVTREDAVRNAFDQIGDRIDILINNAGLGKFGPADEMSLETWQQLLDVNLTGVFLCTRATIPVMRAQNEAHGFGGHILNVASVAGLIGNPNVGAYNVTKYGLRGYSESLFKELRNDGIKVTCIFPGSIETEFFEQAGVPIANNPMQSRDVSSTVMHVLEAPENYLVSEVVMRPLRPKS